MPSLYAEFAAVMTCAAAGEMLTPSSGEKKSPTPSPPVSGTQRCGAILREKPTATVVAGIGAVTGAGAQGRCPPLREEIATAAVAGVGASKRWSSFEKATVDADTGAAEGIPHAHVQTIPCRCRRCHRTGRVQSSKRSRQRRRRQCRCPTGMPPSTGKNPCCCRHRCRSHYRSRSSGGAC